MKKTDKSFAEEIPIEEAPGVIQELVAGAAIIPPIGKPRGVIVEPPEPPETYEQREERLQREDYARRNEQAIKDREAVLRRNGVLKPGEAFSMDPNAAVNLRCCH